MADVTFNIYGGNNQILPNATKQSKTSLATSSQRRSLPRMAKHLNLSPRKIRLCLYI